MSEDIRKFIEEQKAIIAEEKRKLQLEFINVEENEDEVINVLTSNSIRDLKPQKGYSNF